MRQTLREEKMIFVQINTVSKLYKTPRTNQIFISSLVVVEGSQVHYENYYRLSVG